MNIFTKVLYNYVPNSQIQSEPMVNIEGKLRSADEIYHMINHKDRVAVAISGGKDSMAMLSCLSSYKNYSPRKFSLIAVAFDPCFQGREIDYSSIIDYCRDIGVHLRIKRCNLGDAISRTEKGTACSLCSRIRRGALHQMAISEGCNKIALGHHMDDVVETFFLNLFQGGRFETFSPVSYLSRKKITAIRPMVLCTEQEIKRYSEYNNLPTVANPCPFDGKTYRDKIKKFIEDQNRIYPGFMSNIFSAMQKSNISGFGKK